MNMTVPLFLLLFKRAAAPNLGVLVELSCLSWLLTPVFKLGDDTRGERLSRFAPPLFQTSQ